MATRRAFRGTATGFAVRLRAGEAGPAARGFAADDRAEASSPVLRAVRIRLRGARLVHPGPPE
jgi:hypothetical protein